MFHFTFFRKKIVLWILFAVASLKLGATPMNNVSDSQPFHTIQCSDLFYTKKQKGEIRLHLSPFFQHAGAARNDKGRRVPLGERLGHWNMSGLFFGKAAAPLTAPGAFDTDYPAIKAAEGFLKALTDNAGIETPSPFDNFKNLEKEDLFSTDNTASSFVAVDVEHEKLGLRTQLSCDFGFGLGISIKGGVVDYKERPHFGVVGLSGDLSHIPPLQQPPNAGTPEIDPVKVAANLAPSAGENKDAHYTVYNILFAPTAREKLFKEIGLDIGEVRETCLEDTHMQLYWHFPYEMKEKGELSVTMVPCFAVGAWIPTSPVKDQDKAFSIDTGNGGFYGFTLEGSLAFDFPKLVQTSFGGGAVISMEKDFKNYRVPSSNPVDPATDPVTYYPIKQSGFYPWKTTIARKPGVTWYGNASFKADGFNDALSLYFDYIYTYHQKDSITLRETNETRSKAFALGVQKLEEESNWKTQLINIGLDYRINPNLAFGGAVQSMIGGVRVFKTTTVMGSMTLSF